MQVSLFFFNMGQHLQMDFELCMWWSENKSINNCIDQMQKAQEKTKVALTKVKDNMAWY